MDNHRRTLTPMVLICQYGACPERVAAVLICVAVVVPVVPCPVATGGHRCRRMASLGCCIGADMRRLHLFWPKGMEPGTALAAVVALKPVRSRNLRNETTAVEPIALVLGGTLSAALNVSVRQLATLPPKRRTTVALRSPPRPISRN